MTEVDLDLADDDPRLSRADSDTGMLLLTVAVDADDVVTGFADGFGGVGQDGDGVVVTVTR